MTRIRYDIIPSAEGWRISCGDVVGPPYNRRPEAIRDTLFVAEMLKASGERVEVHIVEIDGPRRISSRLELRDSGVYSTR